MWPWMPKASILMIPWCHSDVHSSSMFMTRLNLLKCNNHKAKSYGAFPVLPFCHPNPLTNHVGSFRKWELWGPEWHPCVSIGIKFRWITNLVSSSFSLETDSLPRGWQKSPRVPFLVTFYTLWEPSWPRFYTQIRLAWGFLLLVQRIRRRV